MIHHKDLTVHFHAVTLCPFGQVTEKTWTGLGHPEKPFPSISTHHGVVHRTRGNSSEQVVTSLSMITLSHKSTADPKSPALA